MVKSKEEMTQYILLPTRGVTTHTGASESVTRTLIHAFNAMKHLTAPVAGVANMTVLDSIVENGAKLVEMTPRAMLELKADEPGLRIVPVIYFRPAWSRYMIRSRVQVRAAGLKTKVTFILKDDQGGAVAGASVVAFVDFKAGTGAQGTANSQGKVTLTVPKSVKKFERVYVYPVKDVWGRLETDVKVTAQVTVSLTRLDVAGYQDGLRFSFPPASPTDGQGVRIAVIDSGIEPHLDLKIAGGLNTVYGENDADYGDSGLAHGTHVGGIIASRSRGIAPGVDLYSYRVFGKNKEEASNFAIAKAIERAVQAKCDLINMSLGGGPQDPATASAISEARQAGSVVIAAAGNDDRGPVNYPAAEPLVVAVSAYGRKKTFPKTSTEQGDVAAPFGTDKNNFIAAFSNIGPEIDVTGPGVGIISTVPGNAYVAMSGTSMACPAVTGFLARLLGRKPALLAATRDSNRSDQILKLLLKGAQSLGFPAKMEGKGLPQ